MEQCCATCISLTAEITRTGLKPICKKGIYQYKDRKIIDWGNDKDLNERGKDCRLWKQHTLDDEENTHSHNLRG